MGANQTSISIDPKRIPELEAGTGKVLNINLGSPATTCQVQVVALSTSAYLLIRIRWYRQYRGNINIKESISRLTVRLPLKHYEAKYNRVAL